VNRIGSFVVPFLSLYLTTERGLSVGEAGGLVSLWGLGAIGAGPVAGVVADRLGRRAALLGSLIGGAAFTVALGFVRAPAVVAPLVFAVGFVGEIYRPASHAVVGDVVPHGDRVRAFGLLYWAKARTRSPWGTTSIGCAPLACSTGRSTWAWPSVSRWPDSSPR
jgi:MFS family permease